MSTHGLRKCCHCKRWFRLHPRNAYHQRFCLETDCQAASRRASQQKWCRKNPGYFHGERYVKKVQEWRRNHPGYWKARGAVATSGPPDALQDLLNAQGFDNAAVRAFRDCLSNEISRPLQDLVIAQHSALTGLASMITGEALQEDIVRVLNSCYERGQRIGGMVPWMKSQENTHERTRTDCTPETTTHSPAVQLGRSPPGSR